MNRLSGRAELTVTVGAILAFAVPTALAGKPGGSGASACASATVPAFAFSTRSGKYQTPQVYVADTSGACTRFVGSLTDGPYYYSGPHHLAFRLLDVPTLGGPVTGRIAIHDQVRGVVLMEFTVDPNVVGMQLENKRQVALGFGPSGWGDLALSPDGRRLAVVQFESNWPTQGDYTYRVLVTDVAVCIADLQNCTPTVVYEETTRDTKVGLAVPRWGSDGHVYLQRTTAANLLNPLIVRVSADPPYPASQEVLVEPSGRRVRLFDVQDTPDGDVIVFGESSTLNTQYCYVVKTVSVPGCNLGACIVNSTNMIASHYTSVESVGTSTRVLTQRVSLNNCTTYPTIDRGEVIEGSAPTVEPLIGKGEQPSSAK
jgi:hypothetical protein